MVIRQLVLTAETHIGFLIVTPSAHMYSYLQYSSESIQRLVVRCVCALSGLGIT